MSRSAQNGSEICIPIKTGTSYKCSLSWLWQIIIFAGLWPWSTCDKLMLSPCIMCVQYRGGCSVPWGVQYRGGISWVPWGDILSTVGVFSTVGGYHDKCGGYLEYRGGVQYRGGISWVPWGMFSTVGGYHDACGGDIMSTVGVFSTVGDTILWNLSTVGGYHDTCGGISWVPWGVFSTVGYSNNKRFSQDIPPRYWTPPTVLSTPHGTAHTLYRVVTYQVKFPLTLSFSGHTPQSWNFITA